MKFILPTTSGSCNKNFKLVETSCIRDHKVRMHFLISEDENNISRLWIQILL